VELVKLRVSYKFLRHRAHMSWRDVRFGLVHELLDPDAPVDLALDQVGEVADPPQALLELAGVGPNEPRMELIESLAEDEPPRAEDEIRYKWLYLVLAWIYEHRHEYTDPLQKVEEVYADFGYPQRISGFVRYMPMEGADLGSQEANERRLFERWKQYLDGEGRKNP
jgi:hypothetical protein